MIQGTMLGRSSATNSTTQIAGLKELLAGLSALPFELGKNAIYAALGGAASVVRKEAQNRVPILSQSDPAVQRGVRKPGTLKRAIRVSRSKRNKGQNGLYEVIVRVKPLKGRQVKAFKNTTGRAGRDNSDDPYYWWWVEFGTSKMPARPFLRPAFETTKDQQLAAMRARMKAGLDRAARKIQQQVDAKSRAA
jgi:HK97 gp10 family phage protein